MYTRARRVTAFGHLMSFKGWMYYNYMADLSSVYRRSLEFKLSAVSIVSKAMIASCKDGRNISGPAEHEIIIHEYSGSEYI